ncbi:MAG TPA: hypothetical protein VGK67_34660 [Myxococcales bacterium]|jgi:preprotein translocase subunit SecD
MLRNVSTAILAALALAACTPGGSVDMSKGGLELVYEVAAAGVDDTRAAALADGARKVAQARLAAAKIPASLKVDGRKLRVGLPSGEAATKVEEAKKLLGVGGNLELREVQDAQFLKELGATLPEDGPVKVDQDKWDDANEKKKGCYIVYAPTEADGRKAFPKEKLPSGTDLMMQQGAPGERVVLYAVGAPFVTNEAIATAKYVKDPVATPATYLKLTPEGAKKLEEVTTKINGKKFAIVMDGVIVTTPVVMGPMAGGELPLPQPDVGDRLAREKAAQLMAIAMNAGAFASPLTLVEERQVAKSR